MTITDRAKLMAQQLRDRQDLCGLNNDLDEAAADLLEDLAAARDECERQYQELVTMIGTMENELRGLVVRLADRSDEVDEFMRAQPVTRRYKWCEAEPCWCTGCINKLSKFSKQFTRSEWEAWVAANPRPLSIAEEFAAKVQARNALAAQTPQTPEAPTGKTDTTETPRAPSASGSSCG